MNKIEFGNNVDILKQWAKDGVKVQTCITSPPYFGLRSYLPEEHTDKSLEIGLEETPEKYIERMVEVFRAVRDVLADDGTIWVNIGDSYAAARGGGGFAPETMALSDDSGGKRGRRTDTESSSTTYVPSRDAKAIGVKNKDLIGIPWMLAFALRDDGWYLRQDIIWSKPNPMPESVKDRCTKSHEYIFLLSKKEKYYFDNEAIKEPIQHSDSRAAEQQPIETRNKRDVWSVATKPFAGAHFAVFPPALIEPCVLAGTSERGHCPQCGARWVRQVETISKEVERHEDGHGAHCPGNVPHRKGGFASISKTLGWVPTCECNVEPVPDIVLDTFMGSGTTAMVAKQNGRHYAGCELNTEYRSLQQQRINEPKEKTVVDEDVFDSLFGDE